MSIYYGRNMLEKKIERGCERAKMGFGSAGRS